MRELEFLPEWYPQSHRRHRLVVLQGWLAVLVVLGMGVYLLLADRNIKVAEKTYESVQGQLQQTDAQLAEMDKLEVVRKQLRQQDQIVNRLGTYVEACTMIHTIDSMMPRQMSLTGLQLDNEEKVEQVSAVQAAKGGDPTIERRLNVKVQGVCPTDVDLANFMTQLSSVPFFDQVNITFAKEKSESNHVMREFEVSFTLNLNAGGN